MNLEMTLLLMDWAKGLESCRRDRGPIVTRKRLRRSGRLGADVCSHSVAVRVHGGLHVEWARFERAGASGIIFALHIR
jgi:hypothetical protein